LYIHVSEVLSDTDEYLTVEAHSIFDRSNDLDGVVELVADDRLVMQKREFVD
jgi:hypothetical protein